MFEGFNLSEGLAAERPRSEFDHDMLTPRQ
jgi:hypothetical protein